MRLCAQTLIILGWAGFSGCIFDSRGLSSDAYVPHDSSPATMLDLELDQGMDLQPDQSLDMGNVCVDNPQSAVCALQSIQDQVGLTGVCEQGQFIPTRSCFTEAPCQRGICILTDTCVPCPSPSCEGICTVFHREQGGCCVTAGDNDEGTGADLCEHGVQCKSGLCTLDGNCFQACQPATASCPEGTACGTVLVTFANRSTSIYTGCKRLMMDAGAPDQRPTDASMSDQGLTDANQGDAIEADANASDASSADASVTDALQGEDANASDALQGEDANASDALQGEDANASDALQGEDANASDALQGEDGLADIGPRE